MRKKYFVKPQDVLGSDPDVSESYQRFPGFDIPMSEDSVKRIDRLVNEYEKHIIAHLNDEYLRKTTWADRLADRIAQLGGSWKFIIGMAFFLALWMIWNSVKLMPHFDPPPFILLNLILSCTAAFQAPIIMMSQNRQAARDKHEAVISFAINYKAEAEIDDVQGHLHRIDGRLFAIESMLMQLTSQKDKS